MNANSPVLRVRLQQQERETVVIYIQPASRVQIKQLNQISSQILALEFQRDRLISPPSTSITKILIPIPSLPIPFSDPDSPPTTASEISQPIPHPPKGRIVIIIDPGHGGKDTGAIGLNGLKEKDIILRIGKKLASLLEQNGIKIIMTRDADYFVDLAPRVVIAEHAHADLFVSIHANSIDNNPSANGLETYHYDRGYRLAQVVHKSIPMSDCTKPKGLDSTDKFCGLYHQGIVGQLLLIVCNRYIAQSAKLGSCWQNCVISALGT